MGADSRCGPKHTADGSAISASKGQGMPAAARRRPAHVLLVGLITLSLGVSLGLIVLSRHDWDPMSFVYQGTRFSENDPDGTKGYDGQFTYFIASLGQRAQEHMDDPAFRYPRILYPLLAWVLAGGKSALVPWTMLVINLAAYVCGTVSLAVLLKRAGSRPLYALVYPLWVGSLLALRLDLNELLALAFVAGALVAWSAGRVWTAAGLCALGGLTKEMALICAAGLVLTSFWNRDWTRGFRIALVAAAPYAGWILLVALWLGRTPFDAHMSRLQLVPLRGMQATPPGPARWMLLLWLGLPAIGLAALAVASLARRPADTVYPWLMLLSAWFVLAMPRPTYQDSVAALRVGSILHLAAVPFAGTHFPRLLPFLLALWTPACLLLIYIPNLL